ncbi:hypothetical protein Lal_00020919 [Lupinus albus]|nr:hypothetical protein Lal_00020919 [Lupinus albus]
MILEEIENEVKYEHTGNFYPYLSSVDIHAYTYCKEKQSKIEKRKVTFEVPELEEDITKEIPYGKMKYLAMMKSEIIKNLISVGDKAEKFKGLLCDGIKGEKIRFFMISRKKSTKLKVWVLRILCVILLWTIAMHFKGFGEFLTPRLFNIHSSFSLSPQSTYLSGNIIYS